ncbi:hypothetical protein D3C86_2150750 [compost metagenome]
MSLTALKLTVRVPLLFVPCVPLQSTGVVVISPGTKSTRVGTSKSTVTDLEQFVFTSLTVTV